MKRLFYAVVGVAAALFIASWGYANYTAYAQTKAATEQVSVELTADLPKQNFPYCNQWATDRQLRTACNREQFTGIRAFWKAWSANPSPAEGAGLANCFQYSNTQWGRDWSVAGSCAVTQPSG